MAVMNLAFKHITGKPLFIGIILCTAILCTSCKLDGFLYDATTLDHYSLSNTVIHDTLRTEVELASGAEKIYGIYAKQPDTNRVAPHPIIVYHHGNQGNIESYWPRVELLYRAGFDVFIYDYRGYGKSSGSSTEQGLAMDARAALQYVMGRPTTDTNVITHYGFSLGGVNALYSASELHGARSVIVESVFASGEALVQSGTLLNVPGGYLLKGTYSNVEAVSRINAPLLILHGTSDTFINFEKNASVLYNAAKNPKILIPVTGANHEDLPSVLGEQQYIDLITVFVRGS